MKAVYIFRLLGTLGAGLLATGSLFAQPAEPAATANPGNGAPRVMTLTQTVEPSFRIEPVVHRLQGRRGEILPFEFRVSSTGRRMDVLVQPVRLRQEESGIVLHDDKGEPAAELKINSPTEFVLSPGESEVIRGEVTVPMSKTNYLSFGILVQDKGTFPNFNQDPNAPNPTRAGIRFVTQYVLRVDIDTGNAEINELEKLRLQQGGVKSVNGLPVALAYLENPTDYAFELLVKGTISPAFTSSVSPKPFAFMMNCRTQLTGDDRFLVRIMPRSRLRLEAPLSDRLFPGQQVLHVGVSNGRREVTSADFAVSIGTGDFPALDAQVAYVGDNLAIFPAQLEIGQIKGLPRTAGLRFVNNSDQPQEISLDVASASGKALPYFQLSPREFTLPAGKSKTLRAILKSQRDKADAEYGVIKVSTKHGDETASHDIPVSILFGTPEKAEVEFSDIQLVSHSSGPAFRVIATNKGKGYSPIFGDLVVSDQLGNSMRLSSGYGRWLFPGESHEMWFLPGSPLVPGDYMLSMAFRTGRDDMPIQRSLVVNLTETKSAANTNEATTAQAKTSAAESALPTAAADPVSAER